MNNTNKPKEGDRENLFPIVYNGKTITQEYFFIAIERLQQKFDLEYQEAYELASDMIKNMITDNYPVSSLANMVDGLCDPTWQYLREKSFFEVLHNLY